MKNSISFKVSGRYALFTDPITRMGGEKCSYHIPTYEALKGILKSIYWKPTLIWYVDKVRIMKPFRTQSKGIKPINYGGGNSLAIYTFLHDVEYQVEAHFEWNLHRPELEEDRIDGKHFNIACRMLEKGGRQDIFLGTRDCQAYVEPCEFGAGQGAYDDLDMLEFGMMFHSFSYPDETGKNQETGQYELQSNFWRASMEYGIISFPRPEDCPAHKFVRPMEPKAFGRNENLLPVEMEEARL